MQTKKEKIQPVGIENNDANFVEADPADPANQ
jgi:hypothetical protein